MIYLLLRVFSIFCNFGGASVGSFIVPLFPGFLLSSFVPLMLCVMLASDANIINSVEIKKDDNIVREKNWNNSS